MLKETRDLLGVPGTYRLDTSKHIPDKPQAVKRQYWTSNSRPCYRATGIAGSKMKVEITFDDKCSNGYNIFYITADVYTRSPDDPEMCGCLHDLIPEVFPEFKHLVKWHNMRICEPDQSQHIRNVLWFLSDKDCFGKRKGEASIFEDRLLVWFPNFTEILIPVHRELVKILREYQDSGLPELEIIELQHPKDTGATSYSRHFTFKGMPSEHYYQAIFNSIEDAESMRNILLRTKWSLTKVATQFSEGKPRNFKAAREAARWPEATEEQLLDPNLETVLKERWPHMQANFIKDVQDLGFLLEKPSASVEVSN